MKSEGRLEEGYREMASDTEREREAEEWCDALISDATETADSSRLKRRMAKPKK